MSFTTNWKKYLLFKVFIQHYLCVHVQCWMHLSTYILYFTCIIISGQFVCKIVIDMICYLIIQYFQCDLTIFVDVMWFFFRQCATVTPACSNFVYNDSLNLIFFRLAGKVEINGTYYCENLTWNINNIKDNLQIDKTFDIGQLLTHVSWSEQATECFPSMCSSTSSETSVKEISLAYHLKSFMRKFFQCYKKFRE